MINDADMLLDNKKTFIESPSTTENYYLFLRLQRNTIFMSKTKKNLMRHRSRSLIFLSSNFTSTCIASIFELVILLFKVIITRL